VNKETGEKKRERSGERARVSEERGGETERKRRERENKTDDQPSLVYFLQRTTVTNAFGTAPNMK